MTGTAPTTTPPPATPTAASDPPRGFVSLVGAGPGDPELLTLKAARRLAAADLVLYDGLVPAEVVAMAPGAQRFSVSKRARAYRRSVSQETIHRLMIRGARQGKRVVRLKGGDPFVLGRGGEEALALRTAGVPFEVIPGITAAVAAPELAGIPLTHRGLTSGFVVVSGHAPVAYTPVLEAVTPGSMTVIVLMGLGNRGQIARALIARGWRGSTPTAIVLAASTPHMKLWTGRLDQLGRAAIGAAVDTPGTIVVGEVAGLGALVGEAGTPTRTADAIALQR